MQHSFSAQCDLVFCYRLIRHFGTGIYNDPIHKILKDYLISPNFTTTFHLYDTEANSVT